MKFKAKVDWWYHIIAITMVVVMLRFFIEGIMNKDFGMVVCGAVFLAADAFLVIPIWINTYYTLGDSCLLIKCGLGKALQIPYSGITGIKETRNPLASSAPSLDRLEIRFLKNRTSDIVFISPKNKEEFIRQLSRRIYKNITM